MPFAVAAAAATIGGALITSSGAQSAADTQANAANNATAQQQAQFAQTTTNMQPFLQAGTNALPILQSALGIGGPTPGVINPAQFQASPGYQFQMQQGTNAVQNSASNQGGVNSGNTLKALNTFGQGVANQSWQQYLNNLFGVVGSGQNAAGNLGALGAQNATQVGSNIIGAGNALAAGQIGSANALTNGAGQFFSTLQNGNFSNLSGLFGSGGDAPIPINSNSLNSYAYSGGVGMNGQIGPI